MFPHSVYIIESGRHRGDIKVITLFHIPFDTTIGRHMTIEACIYILGDETRGEERHGYKTFNRRGVK